MFDSKAGGPNHDYGAYWTDAQVPAIVGMTSYSFVTFLRDRVASPTEGVGATLFEKWTATGDKGGLLIRHSLDGSSKSTLIVFHGDGSGNGNHEFDLGSHPGRELDVTMPVVIIWTGTLIRLYYGNDLIEEASFTRALVDTNSDLSIMNAAAGSLGTQVSMGQTLLYPDYILSDNEIAQAVSGAGATPPALAHCKFWTRTTSAPGDDEVTGATGTDHSSTDLIADDSDDYWDGSQGISSEREILSRHLLFNQRPPRKDKVVVNWSGFEAELGDLVPYSHTKLPTVGGDGRGVKNWQRGLGILESRVIQLGRPEIAFTIEDRLLDLRTYWEIGKRYVSGDPNTADGLPRLDTSGGLREFIRNSNAWAEDEGNIWKTRGGVGVGAEELIESMGILSERARENYMTHSSFGDITQWTKVETTGTATGTQDTDIVRFDPDTEDAEGSLKVVSSSATYDIDYKRASKSLAANTEYTFSGDWIMAALSAPDAIEFFIQNDTTGNWYNGSSWQGSRPASSLGGGSSVTDVRTIKTFITEGTASTHTVYINMTGTNSGGSSAEYHIFHIQIELGSWASSRVVCGATNYTRAVGNLRIRNDSSLAHRNYPVAQYTGFIRFTPQWSSSTNDVQHTFFRVYHDSNNYIEVTYDASGSNDLRFVIKAGGTTDTAEFATPTFVRGTEYIIVFRKNGTNGELNLTNHTMSIFLDGVKGGTEDIMGGTFSEAATSYIQIGNEEALGNALDGWLGEFWWSPVVYSDAQIAGFK